MSAASEGPEHELRDEFQWGPYHRLYSPTQPPALSRLQREGGELWGTVSVFGGPPRAKAYRGPLGEHEQGIEFFAQVPPDAGRGGTLVTWSPGRSGVRLEGNYAKIRIRVVRVVP
jgi:hypothetical protein